MVNGIVRLFRELRWLEIWSFNVVACRKSARGLKLPDHCRLRKRKWKWKEKNALSNAPVIAIRNLTIGWLESVFCTMWKPNITMMAVNKTVRNTKKLRSDLLILVVFSLSNSLISLCDPLFGILVKSVRVHIKK